ncbi:hypothetical protein [Abyssalbus ytuae]|uniref:Uncharacterized protein n=1 Tax=Abyssalbus ytuae TaxID=2926907 RepID=A0A9E7CT34_9FLAO|nr:hypothetical protein [Abyssalbus ytuae]UOB17381.1 hypothetical protein MQE35_16790 [Abyssalbus ytuae]
MIYLRHRGKVNAAQQEEYLNQLKEIIKGLKEEIKILREEIRILKEEIEKEKEEREKFLSKMNEVFEKIEHDLEKQKQEEESAVKKLKKAPGSTVSDNDSESDLTVSDNESEPEQNYWLGILNQLETRDPQESLLQTSLDKEKQDRLTSLLIKTLHSIGVPVEKTQQETNNLSSVEKQEPNPGKNGEVGKNGSEHPDPKTGKDLNRMKHTQGKRKDSSATHATKGSNDGKRPDINNNNSSRRPSLRKQQP